MINLFIKTRAEFLAARVGARVAGCSRVLMWMQLRRRVDRHRCSATLPLSFLYSYYNNIMFDTSSPLFSTRVLHVKAGLDDGDVRSHT